ncbi:pilus assembly protein TadG-related protein [Sedimentitalea sp. JM2-8]|uniref:Pilus assembly protein TadG-related protein n=1 Tax=Sedimentitalea xiamensis TaxID=3050037 RepID=A0ABT7FBT0_9RHOB|nr:pilus assembly protein TadG-related protein [Sedimentitalea xiamensis]MDK3072567.1 pilus assembly protein TadG-related protein [Sedimentitalea xiamensis]
MKPACAIGRFGRSEDGAILVFVAVSLAAMLGMAALAFDFGRVTVTQSELQSYADNVALAAAGELDGHADAITRATGAAANMISDRQTFGIRNKDQMLSGNTDYQLFFYAAPANPDIEPAQAGQLLDPSDPASALQAAFVRVVVATHEIDTPLAAAVASLIGDSYRFTSVDAEAVAGFTLTACDITPMFFCLPQPGLNVTEGQMIKMVSQGGGSQQWGAGNFGFLQANDVLGIDEGGACASAPAGQEDSCALAASRSVSQCFSQRGVETKPGLSVGNMIAGFNTRFDQYDATSKQFRNAAKYDVDNFAAAPNVLDGWITQANGNNCTVTEAPPYEVAGVINPAATIGLPLDDCFAGGGACPVYQTDGQGAILTDADGNPVAAVDGNGDPVTTRIGDGDFSTGLQDYLTVNYGGAAPAWFPASGTRYDIYKAEVANQSALQSLLAAAGKAESNLPGCQPASSSAAANPYRRVVVAAGIDCNTYQGELNGGSGTIPVSKFVEIFLIRPSESDGTGARAVIYGEVIRTIESGVGGGSAGGILHDVVQLYR